MPRPAHGQISQGQFQNPSIEYAQTSHAMAALMATETAYSQAAGSTRRATACTGSAATHTSSAPTRCTGPWIHETPHARAHVEAHAEAHAIGGAAPAEIDTGRRP